FRGGHARPGATPGGSDRRIPGANVGFSEVPRPPFGELNMNNPIRILGMAGSLRRQSYNRSALRAAGQLVPPGAVLDTIELDGIPGFNEDDEKNPPAQVVELKKRIRAADAILIVTPEYNYS